MSATSKSVVSRWHAHDTKKSTRSRHEIGRGWGLCGGVDGMDHSDLPLLRLDFSFRINAKAMCGIYLGAPLPCEGLDSLATILPRIRLGFRVRANDLYVQAALGPTNK